jgi:tetratricopeptide (TPR) repeat protein
MDSHDALNSMRAGLGLSLSRAGNRAEGLALLEESLADASHLAQSGVNVQYQASAAAIDLQLAAVLEAAGGHSRAREHYLQAAGSYRAILVAEPANSENLIALSAALNGAAASDLGQRHLDAAQAEYAQALKISEPFSARNANARYALAATYLGLGDLAQVNLRVANTADQRRRQREQAGAWYRKCLDVARRIPGLSPIDPWGGDSVSVPAIAARVAASEQQPAAQ